MKRKKENKKQGIRDKFMMRSCRLIKRPFDETAALTPRRLRLTRPRCPGISIEDPVRIVLTR